jgi:CDP-diglyceride synthetase
MFKDPETRRKLAIFGIMLACVGIIGVIWAVLSGDAEWWTLIILLPVIAVIRRLAHLAGSITERRASARKSDSDKNK